MYARIVTPQAGAEGGKKTLYFGAEGVKLSYNGRIVGDAKLSLLGDINMPFNQNQWMLTLEGGKINRINGESNNDNTYVVIDCDGIKELSLKGNVQISREVLVPLKENGEMADSTVTINGKSVTNRVRGDFAIKASDWNDLLVKVNITPFAITKQTQDKDKGYFSFFVNNAVLDLSDLRTDASVVFPQYYATHGYLIGGTETWRGLYVESLYVGLPQEFKTEDHVDNRVSFEAQNLLIDSYGVSGSFTANNVFPLEKGVTSEQNAWRYSLDKIGVNLAASKIVGANIAGRIQLPIQRPENENTQQVSETTPETQSATQNQSTTLPTLPKNKYSLAYRGLITEAEYLLQVETEENISFDIWSAEAIIASGSSVELRVKNREFLPKANLSGVMSVYANASPQDKDIVEKSKRDANFKGVIFQELVLQTKAPFVTTKYFGVKGEQKLAGFPASIKNIFVEADNGYANLGFEVTVGLQEERFSASGGMKINGLIVSENNRQRWKYNGFTLTKLELRNVDIGVATVSGSLQIMRKDPLYGNGFMASLSAKDIKGLESAVITVNAAFGYSTYRYWGFNGLVDKLNITTPTGVTLTGFTGGAFYHMIPDRELSMQHKDLPMVLKPDNRVGLALRAGVYGALKDEKVASFMAGFNISTNPNGGLANIGFIGEATIMSSLDSSFPNPFNVVQAKFREMLGNPTNLTDLYKDSKVKQFLDTSEVAQISFRNNLP